jgi:hypothetical protein
MAGSGFGIRLSEVRRFYVSKASGASEIPMGIHEKTWMKKNFIYLLHISDIAQSYICRWKAQSARVRDKPKGLLHLAEPS